jgi:hypothetical protein
VATHHLDTSVIQRICRPWGDLRCRSAVTQLRFPAVIPFGTCVDCSQRIENVIILNSLRCFKEDGAPELFLLTGSGTTTGLFLSETDIR